MLGYHEEVCFLGHLALKLSEEFRDDGQQQGAVAEVLALVALIVGLDAAWAGIFRLVATLPGLHYGGLWLTARVVTFAVVILAGAALLHLGRLPLASVGLTRHRLESQVFWGFVGGLVAQIVKFAGIFLCLGFVWWLWHRFEVSLPTTQLGPPPSGDDVPSRGTYILIFALGAVEEELVFRGLLLPLLRRVTGHWWIAILLSSAFFAAGHSDSGFQAVAVAFALGVIVACVLVRTRSLLAAVVAHLTFNMFQLMLQPVTG